MPSDELILAQCGSHDCTAGRPPGVEPSLKASHQGGVHRVRALIQPPRAVHARMAEDHWGRTTCSPEDHAKRNVPTVRKSKDRQVARRCRPLELWPQMIRTVPP
jgi:hypothetical protein